MLHDVGLSQEQLMHQS